MRTGRKMSWLRWPQMSDSPRLTFFLYFIGQTILIFMKTKIQKASERGNVNFGWLNSNHSFSFGHWYDPTKMNFGALRVLNDDAVKGGQGFGAHPHDNMEIVSIPLKGALAHKDSTGTDGII